MNKYETLFLIKPDLPEDQVQAVLDRLQSRIEGAQGKLAVIEHWGNRPLAYAVQYRGEKLWRGYYVLLTYGGGGQTVDEVERNIKILDHTFRYLTVKLEHGIDPAALGEEVQVIKRSEHAARSHGPAREGEEPAAHEYGGKPPAEAAGDQAAPADDGKIPAETAGDQAAGAAEPKPEEAAPADDGNAPAETADEAPDSPGPDEPAGEREE